MATSLSLHRPLYRIVVREALETAWRLRQFWPFAIFATILQTGGVLDAFLVAFREIGIRSHMLASGSWIGLSGIWSASRGMHSLNALVSSIGFFQAILCSALVIAVILSLALIAQGALVFGINGVIRGRTPTIKECIEIGARFLPKTLGLNIIILGILWISRFALLISISSVLRHPSYWNFIGAFMATIVFLVFSIALTAIHLFALNGMIFDKLSLHQSLQNALSVAKKGWLVLVETAVLMTAVGVCILFASSLLFIVASIPLWLLLISSLFLSAGSLFFTVSAIQAVFLVVTLFVAGAFTVTFQYDTWSQVFTHIDEHKALSKLHRLYYWIAGTH